MADLRIPAADLLGSLLDSLRRHAPDRSRARAGDPEPLTDPDDEENTDE